jgi:hypothetical protein
MGIEILPRFKLIQTQRGPRKAQDSIAAEMQKLRAWRLSKHRCRCKAAVHAQQDLVVDKPLASDEQIREKLIGTAIGLRTDSI